MLLHTTYVHVYTLSASGTVSCLWTFQPVHSFSHTLVSEGDILKYVLGL